MYEKKQIRVSVLFVLSLTVWNSCEDPTYLGTALDKDQSYFEETQLIEEDQPILPTGLFSTDENSTEQYIDKISIYWDIPAGVLYSRVFWFDTSNNALLAEQKTISLYFSYELLLGTNYSSKKSWSSSTFDHNSLNTGDVYYYLVKFYDPEERVIGCSSPMRGATCRIPYHFEASKNSTEKKITVNWEWKTDWNCSGFKIYRSNFQQGDYAFITEITDSSIREYTDSSITDEQSGEFLYYKISVINDEIESPLTHFATGKTVKVGAPFAPILEAVSRGIYSDKISISWVAPDDLSIQLDAYSIYAKQGQSWLKAGEVSLDQFDYEYWVTPFTTDPISFYVTGVNDIGEGIPSRMSSGFVIPVVEDINCSWLEYVSQVAVSWNEVEIPDSDVGYNLYRSEDNDFDILDPLVNGEPFLENNYADIEADEGNVYYYFTTVVNMSNLNEGMASEGRPGIRGIVELPQFSVSQGTQDTIVLTLNNYRHYLNVSIYSSRAVYSPQYFGRPSCDTIDGEVPVDYGDSLRYKSDPHYHYTAYQLLQDNYSAATFTDENALPGISKYKVKYNYKNQLYSPLTNEKTGYRRISDEEFLSEFIGSFSNSQYKLKKMHLGGLSAAGEDGPYSGDIGGSVFFNAQVGGTIYGFGATTPVVFSDYLDYYLTLNSISGNPQTSFANASQVGDLHGGNLISGIYNGEIICNLAVEGGKKCSGHSEHPQSDYKVRQKVDGVWQSVSTIPWDFDRQKVNDYLTVYPY